jgi:hypothetical protein
MEKSQMLLADQFEAWRLVAGQQQGFESWMAGTCCRAGVLPDDR